MAWFTATPATSREELDTVRLVLDLTGDQEAMFVHLRPIWPGSALSLAVDLQHRHYTPPQWDAHVLLTRLEAELAYATRDR